jgi:thioredoxin-like negative regulator of GroEL
MAKPDTGGKPTVRLNDATFADWTEKRVPFTLVLVRSAACAQSLELEPMLAGIAGDYRGKMRLATIDADESPETLRKHKVDGVPTVLLFRDGRQIARVPSCRVSAADVSALLAKHDKEGPGPAAE